MNGLTLRRNNPGGWLAWRLARPRPQWRHPSRHPCAGWSLVQGLPPIECRSRTDHTTDRFVRRRLRGFRRQENLIGLDGKYRCRRGRSSAHARWKQSSMLAYELRRAPHRRCCSAIRSRIAFELPGSHSLLDERPVSVRQQARCCIDPAVVVAAGLGAMGVDGTGARSEKRAAAVVAVAHQPVPAWQRCADEHLLRHLRPRHLIAGPQRNRIRRNTATHAIAARHVSIAFATQHGTHRGQPFTEWSGIDAAGVPCCHDDSLRRSRKSKRPGYSRNRGVSIGA
jgi:hypothetical protein